MSQDRLLAILDRIIAGDCAEADLEVLKQALSDRDEQLLVQLGKYNVSLGEAKDIHIGDRNYVEIDDKAVQAIVNAVQQSAGASSLGSLTQINFEPYLRSLVEAYAQKGRYYTPTEAITLAEQRCIFALLEPTVSEKSHSKSVSHQENYEKCERLSVLAGILKYSPEHVLLAGRPGSGKSTALLQLLLEIASQTLGEGEGKIPILVELRYWQTSVIERIRAFLQKHDSDLSIDSDSVATLLHQGRFLLLIDGVNELPCEESRRDLSRLEKDFPQAPMIFTSRESSLGGELRIDRQLKMQPLDKTQMQQFIYGYLGKSQGKQLVNQLKGRLRELGETPLLLAMLCSIFPSKGHLPKNLGEMFRQFTEFYENRLKGDVPDPNERRDDWSRLLQHLAFAMIQGLDRGHPRSELKVTISKLKAEETLSVFLQDREPYPVKVAESCLKELIKHHLIQNNENQIEFRHQLIQEYYAAEYLLRSLPNLGDEELKQTYLNYSKWTESIALMIGLMTGEDAVRIVKLAFSVDLTLGLRLTETLKACVSESTFSSVDEFIFKEVSESEIVGEHKATQIDFLKRTYSRLALSEIAKFLKDSNPDIALKAATSLGHLGYREAVPYLLDMLSHLAIWIPSKDGHQVLSDRTLSLEVGIIEAIGMLSPEDAIPHLQRLADSHEFSIFNFLEPRLTNLLSKYGPEKLCR